MWSCRQAWGQPLRRAGAGEEAQGWLLRQGTGAGATLSWGEGRPPLGEKT